MPTQGSKDAHQTHASPCWLRTQYGTFKDHCCIAQGTSTLQAASLTGSSGDAVDAKASKLLTGSTKGKGSDSARRALFAHGQKVDFAMFPQQCLNCAPLCIMHAKAEKDARGHGCMRRLAARLAKLSNEANTQLAQLREPQNGPHTSDTGAGESGSKRGTKGVIVVSAYGIPKRG